MHRVVMPLASIFMLAASAMPASAMFFNKKCGCKSHAGFSHVSYSPIAAPVASSDGCGGTVMVPTTVMEVHKVKTLETIPTVEDRSFTFTKYVPVQENRTRQVTSYTSVTKTRTVNVTVFKQQMTPETRNFTVMVPHQETRQGVRTICNKVPVTEMRSCTKDCGHWEHQCVQVGCKKVKTCCGCEEVPVYKNKKFWVANLVTTQVPYTTCKIETQQVPYSYNVTVCTPESRTETINVCKTISSIEPRTETYVECVPTVKDETFTVTVCKPIIETKVEKVTVYKQNWVEKDVQVAVVKMVAQAAPCSTPAPSAPAACCVPAPCCQ